VSIAASTLMENSNLTCSFERKFGSRDYPAFMMEIQQTID
jgi:hypothetical protein